MGKKKWTILFYLWLGIVCYLSLIPTGDRVQKSILDLPHLDKIVHAGMYFVLSFIAIHYLHKTKIKHKYLVASLFCIGWGILMEFLQSSKIINRDFDIADIIANIIGSILGIVFFKFYKF